MAVHIFETLDLPDCKVVVFDWSSNRQDRFENLVCFNGDGSLRWRAALPQNSGTDCFVGITLDDGQLRANTMSCFAMWLDLQTGRAVKTVFTK
jgi:hypothetical protein